MAHILVMTLDSKSQYSPMEPVRPILAHDSDTTIVTANLDNSLTVHELRRISRRKDRGIVKLYLWVVREDVEGEL